MDVLGIASFLVFGAFALHVLLWRAFSIRHNMLVFIVFFAACFSAGVYLAASTGFYAFLGFGTALGLARTLHLAVVLTAFTCGYFLFYHMLIDDSPTVTVIGNLHRAGEAGLRRGDFSGIITNEGFVLYRLDYLVGKGHLRLTEGRYFITEEGKKFHRFIMFFKALMNMDRDVG